MPEKNGSNDLNLLLKAKVVELKVKFDIKGSDLPAQVDKISDSLIKKPVKLKVELSATITDMNNQIKSITGKLTNAKSFKPMKIGVEIDVKGSADRIKKQLKEVTDVVTAFNKTYGKQLQEMQKAQIKAQNVMDKANKGTNIKNDAGVQGFNNIKSYVTQMEQAEKQLRGKFNDGKGLFSSVQMKDAQGNLQGFVATLERANGVVEKIRYSWNSDKNQFQVIDRQTVTQTEKMVHKASQSLENLQRELGKTGKASKDLAKEYKELERAGNNGTLTSDMVKAYDTKVKNAIREVQIQKELNDLKREEKKLLREISNATKGTQGNFRMETQALMSKTRKAEDMDAMKDVRAELGKLNDEVSQYKTKQKEAESVDKKRQAALKQLNKYLRETNEVNGALSRDNIKATAELARRAKTTEQMKNVQKQLNSMLHQEAYIKDAGNREKALRKLKETMMEMARVTGRETDTIEKRFKQLTKNIGGNVAEIESRIKSYQKTINSANDKAQIAQLNRQTNSVVPNVKHNQVRSLIDEGDVSKIKEYLATTQKLDIATAKIATNSKGVTRITATLESTGKVAKQVTYEIDQLNNKLRFMGQQDVFNRNANLGIFEQMKIALARVPVWMGAMTAFYGTIRGFEAMGAEILKVDKALTELKRVASTSLNIDSVFQGSIDLSKELGNNIHDIMDSVNDLSRTYGEFNERQLLAVAKTATLMSNVSDLSAQEATETLVGTMNAFNIVAEDSIRIVDSLNEVDNDYAISTKQLATGLQKSASTAKTFGVEMEENVGHITAIGAVTMESGNIIGNSLKTIYSRITTMNDAKDVLEGVGVSLYNIGENGVREIKPVNDILADLGEKWRFLSDEERQNISVKVAGRYQLSRFLALMNNWQMSTKATATALSSQGSAMRENAKLMDSFESRINKLKTAFTEFALSMGEAFMSSSMFLIIEGLTDLASAAAKAVDTFGALPAIFGILATLGAKMGLFKGVIGGIGAMLSLMKGEFINASGGARTFGGAMAGVQGSVRSTQVMLPGLVAGLKATGVALKGILASTGVGLIFVGIGIAVEQLLGHLDKQKRINEKVEKSNKQLVDSYRNTQGGLQNLIDTQADLQRKVDTGAIKEGTDEYNEYVKVTNELAEKMPTVVKYIDQSGLAHLKTADAIEEQYKAAKKLSELENEKTKVNFQENLDKILKGYKDQTEAIAELEEKLKSLKKAEERAAEFKDKPKKAPSAYHGVGLTSGLNMPQEDFTKEQQRTQQEILDLETSRQEALQKTMELVQNTTMAFLESDQKLVNLTDAGKGVIENMVQTNEELLKYSTEGGKQIENDIDTIEARGKKLKDLGVDIGEFMSAQYESMTKGVTDPYKIQEIQASMDSLVKTLPSTFFKLESLDNVDVLKTKFQGVLAVAEEVKAGTGGTFDGLVGNLQDYGFTADEAKGYVANLALEYDNAAIRQQAMTTAQDEGQDSLEEWVDTAIQAIDLSEQLFNVNDDDVNAMKAHIQNLQQLKHVYGDNAKNTDQWKASMEALSLFTGIPEESISKDLKYYQNMLDLMGKVELQYDENTGALTGFNKEGLNDQQIKMLKEMVHLGREHNATIDLMTGKIVDLETGAELVYDKNGKLIEKVKEVNKEIEKKPAKNGTKESADEAKKSVNELKQTVIDNKNENLFNDGDPTPTKQKEKVDKVTTSVENYGKKVYEAKMEGLFNPNDTSPETTKTKVEKVGVSIDATKKKMQDLKKERLFAEEETNAGAGTTKKIDDLTAAIQKASSGTEILNTLNTMIGNSTKKAGTLLTDISKLASGMDGLSMKIGGLNTAKVAIEKMASSLGATDFSIGNLFTTISNGASKIIAPTESARAAIAKIGTSSTSAKGKVEGLGSVLAGIGGLTTGNLPAYVSVLGELSRSLQTAAKYGEATADAQVGVVNAFNNVVNITKAYNSAISDAGSSMGTTYKNLAVVITIATELMIKQYARNVAQVKIMVKAVDEALKDMVADFGRASDRATNEVETMVNQMHKEFKSGMDAVVTTASNVPARIGKAIRDNMNHASGAMDAVAKDMVKRFKSELGIHSPSRVFEDLGGWVIKGLSNGLTGTDLKQLGQDVFSDFGGEAYNSIDAIKDYMQFGGADAGLGASFGEYTKTSGFGYRIHPITGERKLHAGQDFAGAPNSPIQAKAGGRVVASGASGTGYGNYVKVQNGEYTYIYAHLNRALAPVGSTVKKGQLLGLMGSTGASTGTHLHYEVRKNGKPINPNGYQKGGIIDKEQIAKIGEHGRKEAIIPLEQYRDRALGLWSKAGQYLGIDPQLIGALRENAKSQRSRGGVASNNAGSFGGFSGDGGGESGGGDSGSSGVMQTSIYEGLRSVDGGYEFTSLAVNREGIADAFKYDKHERSANSYESQISLLEIKMNALNKSSVAYRDTLKKIVALQNSHLKVLNQSLASTEKRQKTIKKELAKLPALKNQSTKQRETYNSLMQEYDGNLGKISSLRSSIATEAGEIKSKSLEIFTDFIEEIVSKYDKSVEAIKARIDNTEFKIDVMALTNPDDKEGLLNALGSKATDLQKQQATSKGKVNSLQSQYNSVSKSKGYWSKEAKMVLEALNTAKEEYEDYTLAVLQAEKEIKDTREGIANDGIDTLKDYHSSVKDMAISAIDLEIETLEEAHKKKMDLYDEEVEKINSVYDEKIKAMDKEKADASYEEELNEKNTSKAELVNKISLLSRDTSLEGQKKLADLKKELAELDKEISDFQKERQDDLLRQSLEDQKQAQLDAIAKEKEQAQENHDGKITEFETQKEEITKQYEDLINNDKYWADMRNEAIKGNFATLNSELLHMNNSLIMMNKGLFNGLFDGFSGLSEEVKKQVQEINELEIDNMKLGAEKPYKAVRSANRAKDYEMKDGKVQKNGTKVTTPNKTTPAPKKSTPSKTSTPSKSSGGSSSKSNAGKIKTEDGSYVDPSFYGYDRKTTANVNFRKTAGMGNNVISTIPKGAYVDYIGAEKGWAKVKYKGKTGYVYPSYLQKFDTGGYTGDWAGDDGRVAMLHKKELVLNERQTSDILDTAVIIDKVARFLPDVKRSSNANKLATAGSIVNISYGDINVTVENGDKKKGNEIASEIMKGLKKRGK